MYETLASFAQTGGLIYFVLMFAGALTYALWPRDDDTADAPSTSNLIVLPVAGPGFAGLTLSGSF